VFIETGRSASALAVPQSFIHWRNGNPGVFVNDHGKACWREVTLGLRGRDTTELAQGATAGEQVVKPSEEKKRELTDGQRITVR
jgi:HlyD family secretion protein